jgi:broad specificity phosphatase PhoE
MSRTRKAVVFSLLVHFACALVSRTRGPRTRNPPTTFARTYHAVLGASSSRDGGTEQPSPSLNRRIFLGSLPLIAIFQNTATASAKGLVKFPCDYPLVNRYHLMRAGKSLLEEQGIWSTEPLFLANREDALAASGQEQVVLASQQLKSLATRPTVVKYSLAASCIDTVNIIGRELKMGRDQQVPEITFMDPRGIGKWDMLNRADSLPAVWAMDADEAGPYGLKARPPPNEDGTPNETLEDQFVRLRQVMSNLEATYSRDTILLIFPDGTGPALLSAMIAGIPYNRVHELEFAPGELRLDVTYESILALWKTKQNDPAYAAVLEQGRAKLAKLRSTTDIVSLKDEMIEKERIAMEEALQEKQMKRQQEGDTKRRRQLQERGEELFAKSEQNTASPGVLAAVSVSLVGGGLLIGMTSQDKDNLATDDLSKIPPTSASNTISLASNTTSLGMTGLPIDLRPSLPSLTPPAGNAVSSLRKLRVNGDSGGTLPTTDDKHELAQQAMDEYMERDDGADAWLNAIAEIAAEDEEDKDKDIHK